MIVDNQIIKKFCDPLNRLNPCLLPMDNPIHFRWPSLLECLGLGSIFSNLEPNQLLFEACIASLSENEDIEVIHHLYDRLFAENLNQINALPEIKSAFLLQAIKEHRGNSLFDPLLDVYEKLLTEKPSDTLHDLILYLAWDRMCVSSGRLFDYPSTNPKFIKGIGILKDCLIESYQHITEVGRTVPGIYRLLESLLFYHMREENLNKLNEHEWKVLSQSFEVLKAQDSLADFFYIDDAVGVENDSSEIYLTLDSSHKVNSRLSFAACLMNKLKAEIPNWNYVLHPKKIVHFGL